MPMRLGAIPYYLFYNGWSAQVGQSAGTNDRRLGCAAARAQDVIETRVRKPKHLNSVEHYIPQSLTWSDVLLGPKWSAARGQGTNFGPWLDQIASRASNSLDGPQIRRRTLPTYVEAARKGGAIDASPTWPKLLLVAEIDSV